MGPLGEEEEKKGEEKNSATIFVSVPGTHAPCGAVNHVLQRDGGSIFIMSRDDEPEAFEKWRFGWISLLFILLSFRNSGCMKFHYRNLAKKMKV